MSRPAGTVSWTFQHPRFLATSSLDGKAGLAAPHTGKPRGGSQPQKRYSLVSQLAWLRPNLYTTLFGGSRESDSRCDAEEIATFVGLVTCTQKKLLLSRGDGHGLICLGLCLVRLSWEGKRRSFTIASVLYLWKPATSSLMPRSPPTAGRFSTPSWRRGAYSGHS